MSYAVLLFHDKSLLSRLIRWQSRSHYSHAALLTPTGDVIESFPGVGVRIRHISECSEYEAFTVQGMTPAQWLRAHDFALAQAGHKYDWWGVVRFISRRHMPDNDKWFCSELVFASMEEAGVKLLERIDAAEVSPGMLSLSPLLNPSPRS